MRRDIKLTCHAGQVAGDLLREGKISEVYTVLEHTCALLHEERASRERAEACLEAVVEELEAKGPMILQQRQESETAKMSSQQASARLQGALAEVAALGQQNRVLASQRERFVAETAALERLCADLSMQCRALLREVEELRAGRAGASGVSSAAPNVPADALTAEKVVSDQLVIYRNIEELQGQNQKLLSVVRQLSEDQVTRQDIASATLELSQGAASIKLESTRAAAEAMSANARLTEAALVSPRRGSPQQSSSSCARSWVARSRPHSARWTPYASSASSSNSVCTR